LTPRGPEPVDGEAPEVVEVRPTPARPLAVFARGGRRWRRSSTAWEPGCPRPAGAARPVQARTDSSGQHGRRRPGLTRCLVRWGARSGPSARFAERGRCSKDWSDEVRRRQGPATGTKPESPPSGRQREAGRQGRPVDGQEEERLKGGWTPCPDEERRDIQAPGALAAGRPRSSPRRSSTTSAWPKRTDEMTRRAGDGKRPERKEDERGRNQAEVDKTRQSDICGRGGPTSVCVGGPPFERGRPGLGASTDGTEE